MGVGYSASALHLAKAIKLPKHEQAEPPAPSSYEHFFAVKGYKSVIKSEGPRQFAAASVAEILSWRDRVAKKYVGQIDEFCWDERSSAEFSEDVSSGDDVNFYYAAAVFDQLTPRGSYEALSGTQTLSPAVKYAAIKARYDRGFSGRFPQLMTGASYWLSFDKNLVLEEPDWFGNPARFGSLPQLRRELGELRGIFERSKQDLRVRTEPAAPRKHAILPAAYSVCLALEHVSDFALQHCVPVWKTS